MKNSLLFVSLTLIFFSSISFASAHVVVTPSQVGEGTFQTFDMEVPTEKEISTVGLKLLIPDGLTFVSPNVKPGWKINIIKEGTGENAKVTAIEWFGSSIPSGERDDFYFSAKVPATSTSLIWKAYQTYADGSVISWDQDPSENTTDFSKSRPFSETTIINDLRATTTPTSSSNSSLTISLLALGFSIIALGTARAQNKT